MAKLSILAGATSQSVNIFIGDSSKTNGAGLTGLVFNTSNLVAYYTFAGSNTTATAITLVTLAAVNSAFSSGGFKEISSANMPGVYRLDIPNAVLAASSGRSVLIMISGAANMVPVLLEIELTSVDNQSTTFGLSGLTITTNNDKTGYSLTQSFPSNFSSLAITGSGKVGVDGTSSLTESYATLNTVPTLAQLLFEVRALLAENNVASTTVTTKKIDGSTNAHTYTLNSSTAPTSITTAS